MQQFQKLHEYIGRLRLPIQIADLYKSLYTEGPQTISELSRSSGVDRIHIYRLLDDCKASGLIEVETRYKRSILHAAPISQIETVLAKKSQELKDLRSDYKALLDMFADRDVRSGMSRIQFFEGMEGIKQMLWKQTSSKSENLSIMYDNMQNKTNLAFFERWVKKCNERNIAFRGVIGDHFIKTQQNWYSKHTNERLKRWQARYIAPEVFTIKSSMVIFDDTVIYYNWHKEQVYGIKIDDASLAHIQRQFFELLWQQGVDVDDLKGR